MEKKLSTAMPPIIHLVHLHCSKQGLQDTPSMKQEKSCEGLHPCTSNNLKLPITQDTSMNSLKVSRDDKLIAKQLSC